MGDNDSLRPAGRQAPQVPRRTAPDGQIKELLSQGEAAARARDREGARRIFRQILDLDPQNEDALLWLVYLATSPSQSLVFLRQAKACHPTSTRVRQAEEWARQHLILSEESREAQAATQAPRAPARHAASSQGQGEEAAAAHPTEGGEARPQRQPPVTERSAPPGRPSHAPRPEHGQPAMARSQAAGPAGRGILASRRRLVCVILLGVALALILAAYALRGSAAGDTIEQSPAAPSAPTLTSDMGALREQAGQAISGEAWAEAIPLLEKMHLLSPDDDGVRQQLAVAHLRRGLQLVELGQLDEAIAHYDAAIRFYANDMDLQMARRLAVGSRDGRKALDEQRWDEAVRLLEPVYKLSPSFRDVKDLLFTAYLQQARDLESTRQLAAAQSAYARAAELRPDSAEARTRLAEITAILTPPTPTPTPPPRKRIEVDVSQQRLRAYENDTLVFNWVCSTGGIATPTQFGTYQILDKIPEAWSSVWGLRMPYWMGIYWAGGSENGIHALPINRNGTTLWAGYLGRRISYGCIVLDTKNAERLYRWAEIGTTVIVTE